jgi:hypothetical protein
MVPENISMVKISYSNGGITRPWHKGCAPEDTIKGVADAFGYDVDVVKRQPEIAPCPNPECGNKNLIIPDHSGLDKMIFVLCEQCGYRSPYAFWVNKGKEFARAEAIRLHNNLAGRE